MKVLILTNYANGLYLFRKELLQAMTRKGYEVVVSMPEDENCAKVEALGVRLIAADFDRRGMNPFKDLHLFLSYCRLLRTEKPDCILTYTIKPNIYGGLAARLNKKRYIVNITGLGTAIESGTPLSRLLLKLYASALKKASAVLFQNAGNEAFMLQNGLRGVNTILLPGSGVNLSEHPFEAYPSEAQGIVFLAVIRVMKEKGIEEYLEAARQIQKEYPHTQFHLVGEYEEETCAKYEEKIKKLQAEGVLQYYGHTDNVHRFMRESHVIVHPSYHEGMSNVLLEAAAAGRPVLASDVPGCRETFREAVTGYGFAPKSTKALCEALRKLLRLSEEDRKEMGRRGREHMEKKFDRDIVTAIYLREIEK